VIFFPIWRFDRGSRHGDGEALDGISTVAVPRLGFLRRLRGFVRDKRGIKEFHVNAAYIVDFFEMETHTYSPD
jgi:hypothetical protein